jgi:DNA-binding transcriptional MocR family regulator
MTDRLSAPTMARVMIAGDDRQAPFERDTVSHCEQCERYSLAAVLTKVIAKPAESREPLYMRLASELRRQIDAGVLRAGDKLPSIRALRRSRSVSTATAVETYLCLEREGYVRPRDRSGFYVAQPLARAPGEPRSTEALVPPVPVGIGDLAAEALRQLGDPSLVPLGAAALGVALLPSGRLNRSMRRAIARWPLSNATYGPMRGQLPLRRQLARHAFSFGFSCSPDDLIVTSGGMEALNLAIRAVAAPGDVIAVESPTYFGVLQVMQSLRMRVVEIPTDPRTGMNLDLLERAIRRHRVKAVVSMTTCHNPLGFVMTDSAKADLVELTARHETAIVEDGIYSEFAFDEGRRRPAKAFDRKGLVLLCGSFSKSLSPGLRVGWIEAGRFGGRVEVLKSITSLAAPALPQLAVAELLESGFYGRHVRRLRARLANQVEQYVHALTEAFPEGTRMTRPAGGNIVWVQLPRGADGTLLYRRALDFGISIFPGEIFSNDGRHRNCVRVSCGTPWSPAIERAIGTLGRLCRELRNKPRR